MGIVGIPTLGEEIEPSLCSSGLEPKFCNELLVGLAEL